MSNDINPITTEQASGSARKFSGKRLHFDELSEQWRVYGMYRVEEWSERQVTDRENGGKTCVFDVTVHDGRAGYLDLNQDFLFPKGTPYAHLLIQSGSQDSPAWQKVYLSEVSLPADMLARVMTRTGKMLADEIDGYLKADEIIQMLNRQADLLRAISDASDESRFLEEVLEIALKLAEDSGHMTERLRVKSEAGLGFYGIYDAYRFLRRLIVSLNALTLLIPYDVQDKELSRFQRRVANTLFMLDKLDEDIAHAFDNAYTK